MADDERPPEVTPWGRKQEEWKEHARPWGIYVRACD